MTSRMRLHRRKFSIILAVLLIILLAVCFGQVVGKYYLKSITLQSESNREQTLRETAGKKKVLRLKQLDYYSIEAGSCQERERALLLGNSLGQKGLPVVITGQSPYRVVLGFAGKAANLELLAVGIQVEGQKAQVVKGQLNEFSYKFDAGDNYAAQVIAPFIGQISSCLENAIPLYTETNVEYMRGNTELAGKYKVLTEKITQTASQGLSIAQDERTRQIAENITALSQRLSDWSQSQQSLEQDLNERQFLVCQQRALALLEDYHRFLAGTN